jgi:hypothetical protein
MVSSAIESSVRILPGAPNNLRGYGFGAASPLFEKVVADFDGTTAVQPIGPTETVHNWAKNRPFYPKG